MAKKRRTKKLCSKCGKGKGPFGKNTSRPDGLMSICKPCRSKTQKKSRKGEKGGREKEYERKRQTVRKLLAKGLTNKAIHEKTGFSTSFIGKLGRLARTAVGPAAGSKGSIDLSLGNQPKSPAGPGRPKSENRKLGMALLDLTIATIPKSTYPAQLLVIVRSLLGGKVRK